MFFFFLIWWMTKWMKNFTFQLMRRQWCDLVLANRPFTLMSDPLRALFPKGVLLPSNQPDTSLIESKFLEVFHRSHANVTRKWIDMWNVWANLQLFTRLDYQLLFCFFFLCLCLPSSFICSHEQSSIKKISPKNHWHQIQFSSSYCSSHRFSYFFLFLLFFFKFITKIH